MNGGAMTDAEGTSSPVRRSIRIEIPPLAQHRPLAAYDAEAWQQAVNGLLLPAIDQAQEAVHELLGDGGGAILFVVPGGVGDAAWQTAVAGLHGLSRSIAKEYGRLNIRCNMLVGGAPELEAMLNDNTGITGELLNVTETAAGAAAID